MAEIKEAVRSVRRRTLSIPAAPEVAFPLMCPTRERDWVPGWDMRMIHSLSGFAEKGCVFATAQHGAAETVWTVVDYEPPRLIRFIYVTPGDVLVELTITVMPEYAAARRSAVTIQYAHTALGKAGEARIATLTDAWWTKFMMTWETAMNHYLDTGTKIAG